MRLPIYIEAAMGVFLVVILAMAGRNGMIPQNQKNNVMKQSEVEQKSDSDMQNEKEAVAEEATDSIEEVAQTDSAAITAQMCSPAGQYPVMGESVVTVDELADYFNQSGYEYPSEELAKGGADSIETFCQIYCEEAEAEDIRVLQEERAKWEEMTVQEHMDYYTNQGIDKKEAMKKVAKDRGVGKRDIYKELL